MADPIPNFRVNTNQSIAPQGLGPLVLTRGDSANLEVTMFQTGGTQLADISTLVDLTFEIYASSDGVTPVTVPLTLVAADLNPALTLEEWNEDGGYHALFELTSDQTNYAFDTRQASVLGVISGTLPGGGQITFGAGTIAIRKANAAWPLPGDIAGNYALKSEVTAFMEAVNENTVDLQTKISSTVKGIDYLAIWHTTLYNGTAAVAVFQGDSTTEGYYAGQPSSYMDTWRVNELFQQTADNLGFRNITTVNNGLSESTIQDWSNGQVNQDIAANPTLFYFRRGINDLRTRTDAQIEADLDAGLTTFRASRPLYMTGIILCTPNVVNDGINRIPEAFQRIRPIFYRMAIKHQCALQDITDFLPNAHEIAANLSYMDHPFPDFGGCHPGRVMNTIINHQTCLLAFPDKMVEKLTGGTFERLNLGSIGYVSAIKGNDAKAIPGRADRPFVTLAAALAVTDKVRIMDNILVSSSLGSPFSSYEVEIMPRVTVTFGANTAMMADSGVRKKARWYGPGNISLTGAGTALPGTQQLTLNIECNILTIASARGQIGIFQCDSGSIVTLAPKFIDAAALTNTAHVLAYSINTAVPTFFIGDGTKIRTGGMPILQSYGSGVQIDVGAGAYLFVDGGGSVFRSAASPGGISGGGAWYSAGTIPDGGTIYGGFTLAPWLTAQHVTSNQF